MKIVTADYGPQDIDPETLITFPNGMPGFEQDKQFKLFHEGSDPAIYTLQSVGDADVAFSVANPDEFDIGFEILLTDDEMEMIGFEDDSEVEILIVLWRGDVADENSEELRAPYEGVHANLRSPIVINVSKQLAIQKTLEKTKRYTLIKEV